LLLRSTRCAEGARCRRLGAGSRQWRRGSGARVVQHQGRLAARSGPPRNRRRLVAQNRTQPPQIADDLLVDALLHALEEIETLFLVLDQRIALAVTAQPDPFL